MFKRRSGIPIKRNLLGLFGDPVVSYALAHYQTIKTEWALQNQYSKGAWLLLATHAVDQIEHRTFGSLCGYL